MSELDIPSTDILTIEDEPDTRDLISGILVEAGFTVRTASDGASALALCGDHLPDLIITDLSMPGVGGYDLVQMFRRRYPEPFVPILILSAHQDVEAKVDGLATGADDYLTKPFHYRELLARVQALLRVKQLTELLRNKNSELLQAQEELIKKDRQLYAARMAGAAAHNLGQPVTAILLQCRILERAVLASSRDALEQTRAAVEEALSSIRSECTAIQKSLDRLQNADPSGVESYCGSAEILDLADDTG